MGKESASNAGNTGDARSIPGLGRSMEEGMATHSSALAWIIPWAEGLKKLDTTEATCFLVLHLLKIVNCLWSLFGISSSIS